MWCSVALLEVVAGPFSEIFTVVLFYYGIVLLFEHFFFLFLLMGKVGSSWQEAVCLFTHSTSQGEFWELPTSRSPSSQRRIPKGVTQKVTTHQTAIPRIFPNWHDLMPLTNKILWALQQAYVTVPLTYTLLQSLVNPAWVMTNVIIYRHTLTLSSLVGLEICRRPC